MLLSNTPTLEQAIEAAFGLNSKTELNVAFVRYWLKQIDIRLKPLQDRDADFEQLIATFRQVVLDRINEVLTPAIQAVLKIQERGYLVADSETSNTLGVGNVLTFVIPDEDERDIFTPSQFLMLSRIDNPDDWGIARLYSYDKITGTLVVTVESYEGEVGPHDDWQISACAGSTIAQKALLTLAQAAYAQTDAARDDAVAAAVAIAAMLETVEEARDEAVGAKDTILTAAALVEAQAEAVQEIFEQLEDGPVFSVNGRTGTAITGLAEASEVEEALEQKADADDTAASLASKAPSTLDFVAQGSIGDNAAVVLRSDGKVEVVSGSEQVAAIGADNSTINNGASNITSLATAYNGTSNKIAVLYYKSGSPNNIYVAVGSVASNVITFGAEVLVSQGSGPAAVVWNAAGTTIVVAYADPSTAVHTMKAGTVSGTTISLGSAVAAATGHGVDRFYHDDTHGSRVIGIKHSTGHVYAATYSGNTMSSIGSAQAGFAGASATVIAAIYSPANALVVLVGYKSGDSTGYIQAATLSGTAFTFGTAATQAANSLFEDVAWDPVANKGLVVARNISAGSFSQLGAATAHILTISGANITINTGTIVPSMVAPNGHLSIYDAASAKFVLIVNPLVINSANVGNNYSRSGGLIAFVGSVSGTTLTFSEPTTITLGFAALCKIVAKSSGGDLGLLYVDNADFQRMKVATLKVASGLIAVNDIVTLRSLAGDTFFTPFIAIDPVSWKMGVGGVFRPGGDNTKLTTYMVDLPYEVTNANAWIGQADGAYTNGQTAKVKIKGQVADGFTGLTPGVDQYLKGDGTLTTLNNGRRFGKAISSSQVLMEAA